MTPPSKTDYLNREGILRLLSDSEISSLSSAEAATRLAEGEEYVDLENLNRGLQRAGRTPLPISQVLPKKSVRKSTWDAILAKLPATRVDS